MATGYLICALAEGLDYHYEVVIAVTTTQEKAEEIINSISAGRKEFWGIGLVEGDEVQPHDNEGQMLYWRETQLVV